MHIVKLSLTQQLAFAVGTIFIGASVCLGLAIRWSPPDARALWMACGVGMLLVLTLPSVWMLRELNRTLQLTLTPAREIAAGNLQATFDERSDGELAEMSRAIKSVNDRLLKVVTDVHSGTTTVVSTSSQISRDNVILQRRSADMVNALTRTAQAMTQLHATVQQNTDNALQADRLMSSAAEHMRDGGHAMSQVVSTMGEIKDSSRKIVDIIAVIDSIAFQTNILALNAAVEAARAGEQGRGFAVVASEVRTLAQRSANAAKEIKALIHTSSETVNSGAQLVDAAGKRMEQIMSSVDSVAGIVKDISQASVEQREGIATVNQSIAQCSEVTQQNSALVNEVIKSADMLNAQAVTLRKSLAAYHVGEREQGTLQEAKAMLDKAVQWVKSRGLQSFLAEAAKGKQGEFVERDLYIIGVDTNTLKYVAQPINPRAVGLDVRSTRDVNGRPFVKEFVELAMRNGSGSVEYQWNHPVTNEVKDKQTFVERVGNLVLACGAYKDPL